MYKAWEETNPAKRLSLAHKALATSPNCADAYVLLAEEEAYPLARGGRSTTSKGCRPVSARWGRRSSRKTAGYFWGLMETRPYMRARAGLANTLWSLQRRDEAAQHLPGAAGPEPRRQPGRALSSAEPAAGTGARRRGRGAAETI